MKGELSFADAGEIPVLIGHGLIFNFFGEADGQEGMHLVFFLSSPCSLENSSPCWCSSHDQERSDPEGYKLWMMEAKSKGK